MANSVWIGPFGLGFNGSTVFVNAASGIEIPSTGVYAWSSTADPTAAADTGISRTTGGALAIGNGTQGNTSGSIVLGSLQISVGGFLGFFGRAQFQSPADSQFNVLNNAGSVGSGLDVATDAVLKVRTRAQTGYATVDCLGLKASGVAGASGTGTTVSQLTVVNGIVTSCTIS